MSQLQNQSLESLFSITGGGGGYHFGPSGLLVPNAGPSIEFDSQTLAAKGLLIEREAIEYQRFNVNYASSSGWTRLNVTIQDGVADGPLGPMTMSRFKPNAGGLASIFRAGDSWVAGETQTVSTIFKAEAGGLPKVMIYLPGGAHATGSGNKFIEYEFATGQIVPTNLDMSVTDYGVDDLGGGFVRLWISLTAVGDNAGGAAQNIRVDASYADGVKSLLFCAASRTPGELTGIVLGESTTRTTRPKRLVKLDGSKLANVIAQGQGTIFVKAIIRKPSPFKPTSLVTLYGGSDKVAITVDGAGAPKAESVVAGASQSVQGTLVTVGAPFTIAMAYEDGRVAMSLNGGPAIENLSAAVGTAMTSMALGADENDQVPGDAWIQDIAYLPVATPSAELPGLGARLTAWRNSDKKVW